jgi:TolA-binding protein
MSDQEQCDRLWEVDALREGRLGPKDAEASERHIRACEICFASRSRSEELDTWLEDASPREPSALELRRLRVRMLRSVGVDHAVERSRVGMRAALGGAIALCVCIGALFIHRHFAVKNSPVAIAATPVIAASSASSNAAQGTDDFMATVQAADGARWTQTRSGSLEHVALEDGALSIGVRHRNDQERLIVDLPDGTLEDRGTTFAVEAHDGHTTHVIVIEGAVALRIRGADEVELRAGSSWPPIPTTHARTVSTAPAIASANRPGEDDGSASYAAAVSLLRHRSYASAASAFHDYVQAHPNEPDAEDASYLEAVALAQAGDANGAITAAERHLSSYPKSFHRKEASLLIARLARDGGDCAKARKVLAPWLGNNPDPDAQATLRACVEP